MKSITTVAVNLRICGCPNRCLHCWAKGSPGKREMPMRDIVRVLDQLEDVAASMADVHLFLLDEPSYHPEFPAIIDEIRGRWLWGDYSFMATNGHGLGRGQEDAWGRLKDSGLDHLQFTFYGLTETHDRFARRQGAWAELAGTARAANEVGIDWAAGVLAHSGNLDELREAQESVGGLHPSGLRCGAFLPSSQGRGRCGIRPDTATMTIPEGLPRIFRPEGEIVRELLGGSNAACSPAVEMHPDLVVLEIGDSLDVHLSGGCDSGGLLAADPGLLSTHLRLGNLARTSLGRVLEEYAAEPPWPVAALAGVSHTELAERYGDPQGTLLYHPQDLLLHRWGISFLRERISHMRKDE